MQRSSQAMREPSVSTSSFPTDLLVATFSQQATCTHTNTAWERVLGDRNNTWSRLSNQDQRFAEQYLEQALSGKLVTNQVFLIEVPDHSEPVPILLNFLPIYLPASADNPSQTLQGVTISGEILAEPSSWIPGQTQQRRLEMLGRMAMGVTHDFNNLLSSILGYTELLKTALPDQPVSTKHDIHNYLDTIEIAATDGAALIEKIQRYIRKEKEVHFEPINVPELIEDCVALTRPYWFNEPRRQSISIDIELQLEPVPEIPGSDAALREIFVNLVLNAVQAMPEGGVITLSTNWDPSQGVVITIEDTGIGMTDHVCSRIFEPMFTTRGDQGTGMGLAVAYGIIQEHEGSIDVDSAPGEGTTFTLCFPPITDQTSSYTPSRSTGHTRKADILVVDDQEMICDVVDRLLSLKGHTVTQATSGVKALELAQNQSFDIAFTDLGLPDISGHKVAQELRSRYPDLPIVLMTGHTERPVNKQVINRVIDKPFKIEQVEAAIHELLASSSIHPDSP